MKLKQILIVILVSMMAGGLVHAEEYLELLVKTSDNIFSAKPRTEWTAEMRAKERRANGKCGYIVRVENEGFEWGRLEKDPKRYAIIKIAKKDFKKEWLEPEYDKSKPIKDEDGAIIGYEIKTQRKYRLPLEAFLSKSEIKTHKNIPYNEKKLRSAIRKTLKDVNKKIKKVNWENRPAELKLHGSAGTFTIKASGGDYTSLSSWESAESCDLTADGGQGPCIAECFNDWGAGVDDVLEISGWGTDADNYIKIYTPISERHNGTAINAAGTYTGFAIKVNIANTYPFAGILVNEAYVQLDGLIIDADHKGAMYGILAQSNYGRISNCIAFNSAKSGFSVRGNAWNIPCYINNCISFANTEDGFYTGGTIVGYNLTAINNGRSGFSRYNIGTATFKNCLGTGNVNDFFQNGGNYTAEYCASGDNTADDWSGAGTRTSQTFAFVDAAKNDYHLTSTDAGALGYGADLSNDATYPFNNDIDGNIRAGSWDIGADEFTVIVPIGMRVRIR